MLIEPMSAQDYGAVRALWSEAEGISLSDSDSPEGFRSFLSRNPGLCFVARFDGQIVGAVMCGHDGRRGQVYHLAVSPHYRRQGIARVLLDRCLQGLRDAGIPACRAIAFADNADGHQFWKAIGWSERDNLKVFRIPTVPESSGSQPDRQSQGSFS
jgi:ribosomal protein S18 acetylase RimI-like enzyme